MIDDNLGKKDTFRVPKGANQASQILIRSLEREIGNVQSVDRQLWSITGSRPTAAAIARASIWPQMNRNVLHHH